MTSTHLFSELQSLGLAEDDDAAPPSPSNKAAGSRRGGAGPSDHRPLSLGATTLMVPMKAAGQSPFKLRLWRDDDDDGAPGRASRPEGAEHPRTLRGWLMRDDAVIGEVEVPSAPRFYGLQTADGIPYSKIALLHARRVLASTVLQSCVRYNDAAKACQFCAIGTSLKEGRTLARKTPAQLAEVAEAAVRLDDVEQLVLTTGTPATPDRGAAHLAACVAAVKAATPTLPIQVQCEPPDDGSWYARLRAAGTDTLGLHLEAVEPDVRARVMPGKAEVSVEHYLAAFAQAVDVFGRGQVSTYLIAGLGDRPSSLLTMAATLVNIGVYPFLVPFVPIAGTPMANHQPPPSEMMHGLYTEVARLIREAGLASEKMKAGCAKCGACSALASYEGRRDAH